MLNGVKALLRGARRVEWFAALALAALLALILLNLLPEGVGGDAGETPQEARLSRLLEQIDGAGRVDVMISQDDAGNVKGVVILSDGAEDVGVYLKLQRAARTLLDLSLDRIEIIGRRDGTGGAT